MNTVTEFDRRGQDRRNSPDRRTRSDRRSDGVAQATYRIPSLAEQRVQFATRYGFFLIGLLFFNVFDNITPLISNQSTVNLVFFSYFALNTLFLIHAQLKPECPTRYRLAMWMDLGITAFSVANDPYTIPPSLLVFVMVVLGNGMRYGMRIFGEALLGGFVVAAVILTQRYINLPESLSNGVLFLTLFSAAIVLYAYVLMHQVEESRYRLLQLSHVDALTGLLNRRGLHQGAQDLLDRLHRHNDRRLVLLFADMDNFKEINDNFGHATGDEVLRRFGQVVRESIRRTDIAARQGGDEFVLLLEQASLEQAELTAQRLQSRLREWRKQSLPECSVTIGIGEAPTHGKTLPELLSAVDQALYHSKETHGAGGIQRVDQLPENG